MLNDRSLRALQGVHPDLVRVVVRAAEITRQPFVVTEGLRTLERQKILVAKGASKTLRSRHLTGHALDVAAAMPGGAVSWDSEPLAEIARAMKRAAAELGVALEWGGDWRTFTDTPHFQLPWAAYPAGDRTSHARSGAHVEADSWHTETMAAAPPPEPPSSMLASKTGNTALLQGGVGAGLKVDAAVEALTEVAQTASDFSLESFALALLRSPKFWAGLFLTASSAYVWLERRGKLKTWGI